MANILPNAKTQFFDGNGKPLAFGKVYFYVAGSHTIAKDTYQDKDATILNTNPVNLDGNGEAIIFGVGAYQQVVQDALANVIWDGVTTDGLSSISPPFWCGNAAGSANNIQLTVVGGNAPSAYTPGQQFIFVATATNTGPVTASVSPLGSMPCQKDASSALIGGEILVGQMYELIVNAAANAFTVNQLNVSTATTGPYMVTGLSGFNDGTTPNTKYVVSADFVAVRAPATGRITTYKATVASPISLTNDLTLPLGPSTTPTANGCDGATLSTQVSTWIHYYFIGGSGATLATIASLNAPSTGPTLPTGYTSWAYIGAVRIDGSSHLVPTYARGQHFIYQDRQQVVSLSVTASGTQSITANVPPNASMVKGYGEVASSGNNTAQGGFTVAMSSGHTLATIANTITPAATGSSDSASFDMPNVGQIYYSYVAAGNTSNSGVLWVLGYTMPNGGS